MTGPTTAAHPRWTTAAALRTPLLDAPFSAFVLSRGGLLRVLFDASGLTRLLLFDFPLGAEPLEDVIDGAIGVAVAVMQRHNDLVFCTARHLHHLFDLLRHGQFLAATRSGVDNLCFSLLGFLQLQQFPVICFHEGELFIQAKSRNFTCDLSCLDESKDLVGWSDFPCEPLVLLCLPPEGTDDLLLELMAK